MIVSHQVRCSKRENSVASRTNVHTLLPLREVINFVDCLMASSAVHAWEFVYNLSAVGRSYQLH
jgi:hypothetical protein